MVSSFGPKNQQKASIRCPYICKWCGASFKKDSPEAKFMQEGQRVWTLDQTNKRFCWRYYFFALSINLIHSMENASIVSLQVVWCHSWKGWTLNQTNKRFSFLFSCLNWIYSRACIIYQYGKFREKCKHQMPPLSRKWCGVTLEKDSPEAKGCLGLVLYIP